MTSAYRDLIAELLSAIIECDDSAMRKMNENNLIRYYEKDLRRAGFNPSKVYKTKDGRYKVRTPIQICRKNLTDVYAALWNYFYSAPTVSMVFCKWSSWFQREFVDTGFNEQTTLDKYVSDWRRFLIDSELSRMVITEVKPKDIKVLYRAICANAALSKTTYQNVKSLVNAIFRYASDELELDVISTRGIMPAKTVRCREADETSYYSKPEQNAIMQVAWEKREDSVYARVISIIGRVNCRIGEIRALRWDDVDFGNATITFDEQLVNRGNDFKVRQQKGVAKYAVRTEPLSPQALEILRLQKRLNPFGEFVFLRDDGSGRPIDDDAVNCALRRYCKQAGIAYKSSHKFRFFAVTVGREMGLSNEQTRIMAGHETVEMNNHYDRRDRSHELAVDHKTWADIVDVDMSSKASVPRRNADKIAVFAKAR